MRRNGWSRRGRHFPAGRQSRVYHEHARGNTVANGIIEREALGRILLSADMVRYMKLHVGILNKEMSGRSRREKSVCADKNLK